MSISEYKDLILDESGDHNLSISDPHYPLFVLGGVILDKEYAEGELITRLSNFKTQFFSREDITLHTADISRNRNGFEQLKEGSFRRKFYGEFNEPIRNLKFTVLACVIRKDNHLSNHLV